MSSSFWVTGEGSPPKVILPEQVPIPNVSLIEQSVVRRYLLTCYGRATEIMRELIGANFRVINTHPKSFDTTTDVSMDFVVEGNNQSLECIDGKPWLLETFEDHLRHINTE
jgi:hypothetical protein